MRPSSNHKREANTTDIQSRTYAFVSRQSETSLTYTRSSSVSILIAIYFSEDATTVSSSYHMHCLLASYPKTASCSPSTLHIPSLTLSNRTRPTNRPADDASQGPTTRPFVYNLILISLWTFRFHLFVFAKHPLRWKHQGCSRHQTLIQTPRVSNTHRCTLTVDSLVIRICRIC